MKYECNKILGLKDKLKIVPIIHSKILWKNMLIRQSYQLTETAQYRNQHIVACYHFDDPAVRT